MAGCGLGLAALLLAGCGSSDRLVEAPGLGASPSETWTPPQRTALAPDSAPVKATLARYSAGQPLLPPVPNETASLPPVSMAAAIE